MSFLDVVKKVKEGDKKNVNISILESLNNNLSRIDKIEPMNKESWIRASAFPKLCIREEVLCARNNIIRERPITIDNEWWFGVGSAMHYLFQTRLLGASGILLGKWRCLNCGKLTDGSRVRMPKNCDVCGKDSFFLYEQKFEDLNLKLNGHIDGILSLPGKKETIIDFKTANGKRFLYAMKKPFDDHIKQLQIYMMLSGIKRGVILYINKQELSLKDALVEHWIDYDAEYVEKVKNDIHKLRKCLSNPEEELPESICKNKTEARRRKCGIVDQLIFSNGCGVLKKRNNN
jgi:predicted  nucleic acid-binding Zn-ribbon protein